MTTDQLKPPKEIYEKLDYWVRKCHERQQKVCTLMDENTLLRERVSHLEYILKTKREVLK